MMIHQVTTQFQLGIYAIISILFSFTPWDSSVHDKTRQKMKYVILPKVTYSGISWFDVDRLACIVEPLQVCIYPIIFNNKVYSDWLIYRQSITQDVVPFLLNDSTLVEYPIPLQPKMQIHLEHLPYLKTSKFLIYE